VKVGTIWLLLATIAALSGPHIRAQSRGSPYAGDLQFDAVSIKPTPPDVRTGGETGAVILHPNGRVVMAAGRVHTLIWNAYQLVAGDEIVGQPDWVNTGRYDFEAMAPRPVTHEEMRMMLRGVLAERFKLQARYEVRPRPRYALVRARENGRPGPALRRSDHDCDAYRAKREGEVEARRAKGESFSPLPLELASNGAPLCDLAPAANGIQSGGVSMARLAAALTGRVDRRVVDQTGLEGNYEFTLSFAAGRLTADAADRPPTLFTALQEQLGLRLVATQLPVEVLVIERIERPTPN